MSPKKATKRRGGHKLVWTQRAVQDLRDIDEYIATDDPDAAERWMAKLFDAAERAAKVPMAGHVVREREREDVRQVLVKRYRVIYRVLDAEVHILTVFEGHQLLPVDVA